MQGGLIAGAIPLVAGLFVARVAPQCAGASLVSVCTAGCLAIGIPSGVWLGVRLIRGTAPASTWLTAGGIAILAASLGCAGLGLAALAGTSIGLALGAASARGLLRGAA